MRGRKLTLRAAQRRLAGRLRPNPRNRGSVSLWVVIFAFVTMVLLTLVVVGGQVMIA